MESGLTIPHYREVDYHDPSHRYYLDDITYLSATQLLEKFKHKFDTEERAEYMAGRYGQTPEYWKDQWDRKRNRSNNRGTRIHNEKEDFLHGRGFDSVDGKIYRVYNRELLPRNIQYIDLPDGIYPELKLWRHDYRIAGRADKIIIRTWDVNQPKNWMNDYQEIHRVRMECGFFGAPEPDKYRFMDVEDYKTNQLIREESFYTKDPITGAKQHRMMKGPLSHLMDCEMIHYTLQFSIYQFMGEYHGFLPGHRRMIFYRNDAEVYGGLLADLPGETPPVVKELPYLRDEVIAMIEWIHEGREIA